MDREASSQDAVRARSRVLVWYVRVLGVMLLPQGLFGAVAKVSEGRGDDLFHNGLHVVSGLLGLVLAQGPDAVRRAVRFARGFGVFYLVLGTLGWFVTNPFGVLPLALADNVFHLVVGGLTALVGFVVPRVVTRSATAEVA